MSTLTAQAEQQYNTDMLFVLFEKLQQQDVKWYHNIYKYGVNKLQLTPIVYAHMCLLLYSTDSNSWYLLESKYAMGAKDNGPSVGTLVDEVVIICCDEPNKYKVALIGDNYQVELYDSIRVSDDVDATTVLLRADRLHKSKKPTWWDFVECYYTGACEAFLCTDYITSVLGVELPFITTCDSLYELFTLIY